MELEEERRSQKEREQCIMEQQRKIDELYNLPTLSDSNGLAVQVADPNWDDLIFSCLSFSLAMILTW